jgi:hypothetical protein
VNKTLGMILIAFGLFGLAIGEVLRTRPGKRSLTSDRFMLHANRHTRFHCLPSRARWRSVAALCSSSQAEGHNLCPTCPTGKSGRKEDRQC